VGSATRVLSADVPSLNGKPAQFYELLRTAYLAEIKTTASDQGVETELTPDEISSGFSLSYTARITAPDEVLVRIVAALRDRPTFAVFGGVGTQTQLPVCREELSRVLVADVQYDGFGGAIEGHPVQVLHVGPRVRVRGCGGHRPARLRGRVGSQVQTSAGPAGVAKAGVAAPGGSAADGGLGGICWLWRRLDGLGIRAVGGRRHGEAEVPLDACDALSEGGYAAGKRGELAANLGDFAANLGDFAADIASHGLHAQPGGAEAGHEDAHEGDREGDDFRLGHDWVPLG